MKCLSCGKEFTKEWRSSQKARKKPLLYCCRSCANKRTFTDEQNKKKGRPGRRASNYIDGRSKLRKLKTRECSICGTPINALSKTGLCSVCYPKNMPNETKERNRQSQRKRIEQGKHIGWKSRNITSYPEQFFMRVFDNMGVGDRYIHNYCIRKSDLGIDDASNYFLDFYFESAKLDIEIDGKQHKREDRKKSDETRDALLESYGIQVYRIPWRNPICEESKDYIQLEIGKLRQLLVDRQVIV